MLLDLGIMAVFCLIAAVLSVLSLVTLGSFILGSRAHGTKKWAMKLAIAHTVLASLGTLALLTTPRIRSSAPGHARTLYPSHGRLSRLQKIPT